MQKPNLSFWQMWNLSFGFFGVQMAFALQTSQNSRIFETLGADPHNLGYFWILPPLMGMIVQPIVGSLSDKTWCKLGRRKPYLYVGTLIAAIVMFLFPNSGSFSFQSLAMVMGFGATMLMLLDTSLNMAMQPFKMMVGDMVNDEQKAKAYSIQSMLCNAGQVVGSILPKLLALLFAGGVVAGAVATTDKDELMPVDSTKVENVAVVNADNASAEQNVTVVAEGGVVAEQKVETPAQTTSEPVAQQSTADAASQAPSTDAEKANTATPAEGAAATNADDTSVEQPAKTVEEKSEVPESLKWSFYIGAIVMIICVIITSLKVKEFNPEEYAKMNNINPEDKSEKTNFVYLLTHAPAAFWQIALVQFFCWFAFMFMWTFTNGAIAENVWGTADSNTAAFQEAGDWVGVLFAVQSVASVIWALVLPRFRSTKMAYSTSLVLGGIGFISTLFLKDQYLLCLSFALIGCGWAAMLSMPFALLTNSLSGKSMGAYLGLFNCTICLPQIVASLVGGQILLACGGERIYMLVIAGVSLILGAIAVFGISTKRKAA